MTAVWVMPQCIARTEGGKRVVAGVHWDYDCYGAPYPLAEASRWATAGSVAVCSLAAARQDDSIVLRGSACPVGRCPEFIGLPWLAGGTQKLLLGEPTMMPNWDRDAEVSPSPRHCHCHHHHQHHHHKIARLLRAGAACLPAP